MQVLFESEPPWRGRERGSRCHIPTMRDAPRGNGPPDAVLRAQVRLKVGAGCDPIAHTRLGDQEIAQLPFRIGRCQLLADLADVDVDVVVLAAVRLAPDGAQEAPAGDQPARMRDTSSTRIWNSRGTSATGAPLTRTSCADRVDLQRAVASIPPGSAVAPGRPPEDRAYAGLQLGHAERLGHVVVGPAVPGPPPSSSPRRGPRGRRSGRRRPSGPAESTRRPSRSGSPGRGARHPAGEPPTLAGPR